jgi:hypothetical protein
LHGENPETAHSWDRKPRLVREGDRLYLEFVVRVTTGDYRLAMDASDAIPDWLPLPANLGNAMVVVNVTDLPEGIQWRRARLLADAESQSQRFFRSYSHPLEP